MTAKREAIISLFKAGMKQPEIANRLKAPRSTVYDTVKRYQVLGATTDRPRIGRPRTSNTQSVRDKIRLRIMRNPRRSLRKTAQEIHVNRETVRQIAKMELHCKAYKLQEVHLLTPKMKQVRLTRSKGLLQLDAVRQWERIVFSDEKIFTIEQALNRQNDRIWAADNSASSAQLRKVGRSQKPASLMVWAAVTATGKSSLHFTDPGVKMDQAYYRDRILEGALIPWAGQHFGTQQWTFQQDSAPSHRARLTQQWCAAHLPAFINSAQWPPYSPDLNPLDYAVWGILEAKACSKHHGSLESLKRSLVMAWNEIDVDMLRRICAQFPDRLKAVVREKGGYIEQ
jgi:transposase